MATPLTYTRSPSRGPRMQGLVASHRVQNTRAVLGAPAGPPPAGERFPLPRTEADPQPINAWPPEWQFWLGVSGPRAYATMNVPMASPWAGTITPGTRLPPVQSLFTPVPAIPGTGPGNVNDAYRIGWAFASGAAVTWQGRTNRGREGPWLAPNIWRDVGNWGLR